MRSASARMPPSRMPSIWHRSLQATPVLCGRCVLIPRRRSTKSSRAMRRRRRQPPRFCAGGSIRICPTPWPGWPITWRWNAFSHCLATGAPISLFSIRRRHAPRWIFSAARAVLGLFDRFSGLHLLADVQEFVRSFDGMYEGFASRAADAAALLHDRATAIVLVSTTDEKRIAEIQEFAAVLDQRGLRINAVIVNRAMPRLGDPSIIEQGDLPAALAHKLRRCLESYNVERARESRALEQLRGTLPPATRILIASDVGREPSSIRDLLAVADGLRVAD